MTVTLWEKLANFFNYRTFLLSELTQGHLRTPYDTYTVHCTYVRPFVVVLYVCTAPWEFCLRYLFSDIFCRVISGPSCIVLFNIYSYIYIHIHRDVPTQSQFRGVIHRKTHTTSAKSKEVPHLGTTYVQGRNCM
jgi:hypothetical protein